MEYAKSGPLGSIGVLLGLLGDLALRGSVLLGGSLSGLRHVFCCVRKANWPANRAPLVTSFGRKKNSTRERREKRGADEISALDGSPRPSLVICRAF